MNHLHSTSTATAASLCGPLICRDPNKNQKSTTTLDTREDQFSHHSSASAAAAVSSSPYSNNSNTKKKGTTSLRMLPPTILTATTAQKPASFEPTSKLLVKQLTKRRTQVAVEIKKKQSQIASVIHKKQRQLKDQLQKSKQHVLYLRRQKQFSKQQREELRRREQHQQQISSSSTTITPKKEASSSSSSSNRSLYSYEAHPILRSETILVIGMIVYGLSVVWRPLVLVVAVIASRVVPYCYRTNDDAVQRRQLIRDFEEELERHALLVNTGNDNENNDDDDVPLPLPPTPSSIMMRNNNNNSTKQSVSMTQSCSAAASSSSTDSFTNNEEEQASTTTTTTTTVTSSTISKTIAVVQEKLKQLPEEQQFQYKRAIAISNVFYGISSEDVHVAQSYWINRRGMALFTCTMTPKKKLDNPIQAVACFCHGYTDYPTVTKIKALSKLVQAGIAVVMIEYEGHGRSDGTLGLIYDWDELVEDTSTYFSHVLLNTPEFASVPAFLMGESMGGAVAYCTYNRCCRTVDDNNNNTTVQQQTTPLLPTHRHFQGVVLVCPMCKISPDMLPPDWVIDLFQWIAGPKGTASFFGTLPIAPSKGDFNGYTCKVASKNSILTSYPAEFGRKPRLATAREMIDTTVRITNQLSTFDAPFLIQHGKADRVTDPNLSEALYQESKSTDKTLKLYEGFWHSLLSGETDENISTVVQDSISWILERSSVETVRPKEE